MRRISAPGLCRGDDLTREVRRACRNSRADNFAFLHRAYDGIAGWWNWGGAGTAPHHRTAPVPAKQPRCSHTHLARSDAEKMPAVVFTARPQMDHRELIGRWVLGPGGMTCSTARRRSHGATAGYSSSMSSQQHRQKSGCLTPHNDTEGLPSRN